MRFALFIGFALLGAAAGLAAVCADAASLDTSARSAPVRKVSAQDDDKKQLEKATETEESDTLGPIGVFADIEEGWRKSKLDPILRHFGKAKVAISIEGDISGGTFSKSQTYYLLQDLFKYTITSKFEFVQYRNVSDGRVKVYAVAEREFRRNDDGRLFEDKIYVSLQLEEDRWVISEIKSVR